MNSLPISREDINYPFLKHFEHISKTLICFGILGVILYCPETQAQNTPSAIYERTHLSIVVIVSADKDAKPIAQGSGFVVSRNRIATNHHVIEEAAAVIIVFADGGTSAVEGIVADSPKKDLTILSVETGTRPALKFGDELSVRQGDPVYAIGAPRGLELSITNGIVSGFRHIEDEFMIQNTAPIAPGSSGGPLFDREGHVIGVTTSLLTDTPGIYFSIGAGDVRRLIRTPNIVIAPLPKPTDNENAMTAPATAPAPGSSAKVESSKGSLLVSSEPAGAIVFVNGIKQSGQTPLTLSLSPGQYNLALRLAGYVPYAASVHVEERPQQINVELNKDISGTYRGTVHNSTARVVATFGIFIRQDHKTIRGCMEVQRPLYGSGPLRGSIDEDAITFTISSTTYEIIFRGIRKSEKISGTYKVTRPYPQVGEFDLEKSTADAPSSTFDINNCPLDPPNG